MRTSEGAVLQDLKNDSITNETKTSEKSKDKPEYGAMRSDYPELAQKPDEDTRESVLLKKIIESNGSPITVSMKELPDDIQKALGSNESNDKTDKDTDSTDQQVTIEPVPDDGGPSRFRSIIWSIVFIALLAAIVAPWNFIGRGSSTTDSTESTEWSETKKQADEILKTVKKNASKHEDMTLKSESHPYGDIVSLVDSDGKTVQVWKTKTYGDPSTVSWTPTYELYPLADGSYKLVYSLQNQSGMSSTTGINERQRKSDTNDKSSSANAKATSFESTF